MCRHAWALVLRFEHRAPRCVLYVSSVSIRRGTRKTFLAFFGPVPGSARARNTSHGFQIRSGCVFALFAGGCHPLFVYIALMCCKNRFDVLDYIFGCLRRASYVCSIFRLLFSPHLCRFTRRSQQQ